MKGRSAGADDSLPIKSDLTAACMGKDVVGLLQAVQVRDQRSCFRVIDRDLLLPGPVAAERIITAKPHLVSGFDLVGLGDPAVKILL